MQQIYEVKNAENEVVGYNTSIIAEMEMMMANPVYAQLQSTVRNKKTIYNGPEAYNTPRFLYKTGRIESINLQGITYFVGDFVFFSKLNKVNTYYFVYLPIHTYF